MALGQGYVQSFDDMFNRIIIGSLERGLNAVSNKVMDGLGALGEAASNGFSRVTDVSLGGVMSLGGGRNAEVSAPAPAIEPPSRSQNLTLAHEVSHADLGTFSPLPTPGAGGISVGIGGR